MALRPNPAQHLFFANKYYWNTAMHVHLHTVYMAAFLLQLDTSTKKTYGPSSLKDLLSDPLQKMLANLYARLWRFKYVSLS